MYQLIGAPVSLYTGKVRSYLQFKGIPFTEQLATPQVYRDLIIPRTGVRYIPVLVTPRTRYCRTPPRSSTIWSSSFPSPPSTPPAPARS